jgi:hypothetical protein
MADEESWAKKPFLLYRNRQLDEIADLLERCCESAGVKAGQMPLCDVCYRNFRRLADKREDKLTSEDTRNMIRITLIRKQITTEGGSVDEKAR